MRAAIISLLLASLAACGQTGALYLPDESVKTPVEIRGPADADKDKDKDKKDEKPAPPSGP